MAWGTPRRAAEDAAHEESRWVNRRRRKFLRCGLGCLRCEGEGRSGGEVEEVEHGEGEGGEGEEREPLSWSSWGEDGMECIWYFTISAYIRRKLCIVAVYVQKWNDNVRDSGVFLCYCYSITEYN